MFLIEGVVLVILGLLAVAVPQVATIAVTVVLGWLFLISGVVGLATSFMARGALGFGGRCCPPSSPSLPASSSLPRRSRVRCH